eukprot:2130617-Amphidinium_carterae.1
MSKVAEAKEKESVEQKAELEAQLSANAPPCSVGAAVNDAEEADTVVNLVGRSMADMYMEQQ